MGFSLKKTLKKVANVATAGAAGFVTGGGIGSLGAIARQGVRESKGGPTALTLRSVGQSAVTGAVTNVAAGAAQSAYLWAATPAGLPAGVQGPAGPSLLTKAKTAISGYKGFTAKGMAKSAVDLVSAGKTLFSSARGSYSELDPATQNQLETAGKKVYDRYKPRINQALGLEQTAPELSTTEAAAGFGMPPILLIVGIILAIIFAVKKK